MEVIKQARNTFQVAKQVKSYKIKIRILKVVKHRIPLQVGWLNWDRNASTIEVRQSTTIPMMRKDNSGRPQYNKRKIIGHCPILLVETLTIREVIMVSIQETMSNIFIESDSQIAIRPITGAIIARVIISIL